MSGKTVNIKFYSKHSGILDINPKYQPDYYLVLSGLKNELFNKWSINSIFLIDNNNLMDTLKDRGVKIGAATSVIKEIWAKSEVYPSSNSPYLNLGEDQIKLVELFK